MKEIEVLKRRIQREIKARKSAERILEEKALELFSAVQKMNDVFLRLDSSGCVREFNPAAQKLLNYSQAEFLKLHFTDFVIINEDNSIEELKKIIQNQDGTSFLQGIQVKTRDGKILHLEVNAQPVFKNKVYNGVILVARDISKRMNAEKAYSDAQLALKISEQKYRGIIENMDLGVVEVNNENVIVKTNSSFCKLTGYTEEEILFKNPDKLLQLSEETIQIIKHHTEKRKRGTKDIYEIKARRKTGKEIWLLISGGPILNVEGKLVGTIGIHYDITERKQLEESIKLARREAEKAQEAEKQFLANISHEIKTPLNVIVGMTNLLKDTKLNAEQDDLINVLLSSTDILQNLISDVLHISKVDAGKVLVEKDLIDLPKILFDLTEMIKTKVENKPVEVILEIDPSINSLYYGDQRLLNQVFLNLLSNASKFTEKGFISLKVKVLEKNENRVKVFFEVSDSGIGIKEKDLDIIFDRFIQVTEINSIKYSGTGLGLSIVKKNILALNGSIEVDSELGKGSTFTVCLEFEDSLKSFPDYKKINLGEEVFIPKLPILIVEDNPLNRKYITKIFNKWGISYEIAEHGMEAVEKVKTTLYSIIFMDIQMPVLDGYKTTSWIRKNENQCKDAIIIALTASTLSLMPGNVAKYGFNDILPKPFKPGQLSAMINKHLKQNETNSIQTNKEKKEEITVEQEIDISILDDLYQGDLEYFKEMIEIFKETMPEEISNLNTAIKSENYHAIMQSAHKLKSNFAMVGAKRLSENFQIIESLSRQNDSLNTIKENFASIQERLNQVYTELNKL